ncbi:hypothetical protein DFH09DRAFT_1318472 [Mycena vulgaris]|nr:hypothetical protein DFH09DRAFT_1318472 [Mycena vulgaris]
MFSQRFFPLSTEFARCDEDIGRLTEQLLPLESDCLVLQAEHDDCHSLFAPIHRVPNKTLVDIFIAYLFDSTAAVDDFGFDEEEYASVTGWMASLAQAPLLSAELVAGVRTVARAIGIPWEHDPLAPQGYYAWGVPRNLHPVAADRVLRPRRGLVISHPPPLYHVLITETDLLECLADLPSLGYFAISDNLLFEDADEPSITDTLLQRSPTRRSSRASALSAVSRSSESSTTAFIWNSFSLAYKLAAVPSKVSYWFS